ncbi:MAG: RNA-binding domain-containing protein, partial [Nitrososphaerales archaeon]
MEELQDNIKITIKTELNKTEDKNDLIYAMTNIVDIDYDVKDKEIIGKSTDYKKLMNLYDRLRNKQTTHIARKVLMRNSEKDMTYILFNKQAAAIDSIVICENSKESPL